MQWHHVNDTISTCYVHSALEISAQGLYLNRLVEWPGTDFEQWLCHIEDSGPGARAAEQKGSKRERKAAAATLT